MSITSDIRTYADNAIEQGKQVLGQAQASINDVTGQLTETANEYVGKLTAKSNVSDLREKAGEAVTDLREQAEKAVNLDAIKAAVEPYIAQAKGYTHTVTDRVEELLNTVKGDKRVSALVTKAEELTGTVVETVQERIVKPVESLIGRGEKAGAPAPKPAPAKAAPKPAAAKAAPAKAAAKPAAKTTARKAPAKRSTAAKA